MTQDTWHSGGAWHPRQQQQNIQSPCDKDRPHHNQAIPASQTDTNIQKVPK